jgi:hypothetical protein
MPSRPGQISEVLADQLTELGLKRIAFQKTNLATSNFKTLSLDEIALYFDRRLAEHEVRRRTAPKKVAAKRKVGCAPKRPKKPKGYWKRVRTEMHILLCTNDPKYKTLRAQLFKQGSTTQTVIVGQISVAVGATLGIMAGAIVPFIALCLIGLLQVGKEAYCSGGFSK